MERCTLECQSVVTYVRRSLGRMFAIKRDDSRVVKWTCENNAAGRLGEEEGG